MAQLPISYVLPLRWADDEGLDELAAYVRWLSRQVEVIVVDGSPPALFARHAAAFGHRCRHVPPDPALRYANGKVNGVHTGVRLAARRYVVIADDDVRYDAAGLRATAAALDRCDLVRPHNYFRPAPWHARWDTARTLLNRAFGGDYPGTLGVRRSTFMDMGGYDGDVLFENLELIRTVRAYGGREVVAGSLFVRRLPPTAARFWSQRVRQAYDDLAQPVRLATFLAVLPALVVLARRRPAALALPAVASVAVAGYGRRRAGGAAVYPRSAALFAPVWVLERAVTVWLAVGARLTRGGVRYAGTVIRVAAHPTGTLARRFHRCDDVEPIQFGVRRAG